MDFHKLLPSEVVDIIGYLSYPDIEKKYRILQEKTTYPCQIVDLYIATKMYQIGFSAIFDDISKMAYDQFLSIASYFFLPPEFTTDNIERALRINRILYDYGNIIQIIPTVYTRPNTYGDFKYMIGSGKYSDSLFIFNDNQENFIKFHDYLRTGQNRTSACNAAGGNAAIRPYQCTNPQISAGIPTGSNGRGYTNLATSRPYIDQSINHIKRLLLNGSYKKIYYSAASDGYNLGVSIFSPSDDIKNYIVSSIWSLRDIYGQPPNFQLNLD